MKDNKLLLRKVVKIFLIYEDRHMENMFAILDNTPKPFPNTPSTDRIWFRGLAIWGKEWSMEVFIQGEERHKQFMKNK